MQFASFFIMLVMAVFTVKMIEQRITLKPLRNPDNTADVLYVASMPLGLVGAVLTAAWLAIGFNAESVQGLWIIGFLLFAGLTLLLGVVMCLVFDEGDRIRKEHKRLEQAYEARAAQSQRTGW